MQMLRSLNSHPVIKGGLILTCAGLITRILGFFYRIFLSRTIGAEGMGIYQLIFPVFGILMSLCASGIQTAVSKSVASCSSQKNANNALFCGLFLSCALAFASSILLFTNAEWFACRFLSEPRCAELLKILAFTITPACIHSCINGYYYGLQKALVPSFTQLTEQFSRMGFLWISVHIFSQNGVSIPLTTCIWALAAGECMATLLSLTVFSFQTQPNIFRLSLQTLQTGFTDILPTAIPLTANRLLTSFLSSTESILIPIRLELFGHSTEIALSLYGVLTGMSMPMVLFPTAITVSVTLMLLPSVARASADHDISRINSSIYSTIKYCLLLGILCFGVFLLYGSEIGTVLFHNHMAGDFLTTLSWICPFLYLSSTLTGILNGLGKTRAVLMLNLTGICLRILFICLLIPMHGILAYLWGLLGSLLIQTAGEILLLRPYMTAPFPAFHFILAPIIFLCLSAGCLWGFERFLQNIDIAPTFLLLAVRLFILCFFYVLFYILYVYLTKKETGI